MNIALDVKVYVEEGHFGVSTTVIAHPQTTKLSHVVVRHKERPHTEYLVPLAKIKAADSDRIVLNVTAGEVMSMRPFLEKQFVTSNNDKLMPLNPTDAAGQILVMPFAIQATRHNLVTEENIPTHELSIHRGDPVVATDGRVGTIDEFIINDEGRITHLIMRENHLLAPEREYAIPLKAVERVQKGEVTLNISKREVRDLPIVDVHRWWA